MEALLNKAFHDETDEELERRIQAELDNYSFHEGVDVLNRTQQSLNPDRSFLEREENIEELEAWKELQEYKKADESMFQKFERNIRNLKEITGRFRNEDNLEEGAIVEGGRRKGVEGEESKHKIVFSEQKILESFNMPGVAEKKEEGCQEKAVRNDLEAFIFRKKRKEEEKKFALQESLEEENRVQQEYEWFRMQSEDLVSQKLEEAQILRDFSLKDWRMPMKICQRAGVRGGLPERWVEKMMLAQMNAKIEMPIVLAPSEKNLMPKNSKERCGASLKKLLNPHKIAFSVSNTPPPNPLPQPSNPSVAPIVLSFHQAIQVPEASPLDPQEIFLSKFSRNLEKTVISQSLMSKIENLKIPAGNSGLPFFEENQNLGMEPSGKEEHVSMRQILGRMEEKQRRSIRTMAVKLEKIRDLEGIAGLEKLQALTASMNAISELRTDHFGPFSRIISLNLSQNAIKDYSPLKSLKFLRFLDLEMNRIERISLLEECKDLETLNLNKNSIKVLENLHRNRGLTRLLLYQNQIVRIQGLSELTALEELDLGRNKIKVLEGINDCVNLRKLVLYNNEIYEIAMEVRLMLLSELFLNNNQLQIIENLIFLPSLTFLNLENNEIYGFPGDRLLFWPSLSVLKLGFNHFGSFVGIFNLLLGQNQNFANIEILDYRENDFLSETSPETQGFYKEALIEFCPKLREVNGEATTPSLRPPRNPDFSQKFDDLGVFGLIVQEFGLINQLEGAKIKRSPFLRDKAFMQRRARLGYSQLSSLIKWPRLRNDSLYRTKHDFERTFSKKVHKIQSFLVRILYKKRKKNAFYRENLWRIVTIQRVFRGHSQRKRLDLRTLRLKHSCAVKIQKVFRGFLLRRRKKALFGGIKYEDAELENLEEVNTDFFSSKQVFEDEFSLKIPEFLLSRQEQAFPKGKEKGPSLESALKPPSSKNSQALMKLEEIEGKNITSNRKKLPPIGNSSMEKAEMLFEKVEHSISEISSISRKSAKTRVLPKIQREEEKAQKIMEAWGLKKAEIKETLAMKLEKERRRKEEKHKKTLTAEERFQKFAKNSKK